MVISHTEEKKHKVSSHLSCFINLLLNFLQIFNHDRSWCLILCITNKPQLAVKILNEGIMMCLKSISLYNMYVSTIFYSIVSFTYPIIRLHVSSVCQSSSGLIQISYLYAFCPLWDPVVLSFFKYVLSKVS